VLEGQLQWKKETEQNAIENWPVNSSEQAHV